MSLSLCYLQALSYYGNLCCQKSNPDIIQKNFKEKLNLASQKVFSAGFVKLNKGYSLLLVCITLQHNQSTSTPLLLHDQLRLSHITLLSSGHSPSRSFPSEHSPSHSFLLKQSMAFRLTTFGYNHIALSFNIKVTSTFQSVSSLKINSLGVSLDKS